MAFKTSDILLFKNKLNGGIGLYIHIPFCTKACHYCSFYFVTSLSHRTQFIDSLKTEIKLRKNDIGIQKVQSIYFGGGTPSLLTQDEMHTILETIKEHYDTSDVLEITIETNPDDLVETKVKSLYDLGFNRLSVGVQSFLEEDLQRMNRSHSVSQVYKSMEFVSKYFSNFSIDLMFGLPEMTLEKWKYNLAEAMKLQVPHISTYNLTVEEKTALERLIKNKKIEVTSDTINATLYLYALEYLDSFGLINYEISNFGKSNHWAIHNTSYWLDTPYLGFGPSAHSYVNNTRIWNISNLNNYIKKIENEEIWYENELLTVNNRFNEYIMTKLRTIFGVSVDEINQKFGSTYEHYFLNHIQKYIQQELIIKNKNNYTLTKEGKLLADVISSDLMIVE